VPAIVVLVYTARQAIDATASIQKALAVHGQGPSPGLIMEIEDRLRARLPQAWQHWDISASVGQWAEGAGTYLASKVGAIIKNVTSFLIDLFVVIFGLFYMFRDRHAILRRVRVLLPFEEAIQNNMLHESKELIFASVAVGLIIAGIQGSLGGMAFAITGIPNALFWGVV